MYTLTCGKSCPGVMRGLATTIGPSLKAQVGDSGCVAVLAQSASIPVAVSCCEATSCPRARDAAGFCQRCHNFSTPRAPSFFRPPGALEVRRPAKIDTFLVARIQATSSDESSRSIRQHTEYAIVHWTIRPHSLSCCDV